jgi:hypothetical protein
MTARYLIVAFGLLAAWRAAAQEPAHVQVTEPMVAAAQALLATVAGNPSGAEMLLGFERGKNLALALDDDAREDWTYWPTERVGVPLELMTSEQRRLTHELLSSLLSSRGYLKVVHVMQLEQVLDMLEEAGLPRAVDHYELVIFGTPSLTDAWGWRFEGHHVSLNVTAAPDGVSVTPSFLGSNPGQVRNGPLTGFRVLGTEEDLARELVSSLTAEEQAVAIVSAEAPTDIFSGNIRRPPEQWNQWRDSLQPQGIRVSELNEVQQHWVRRLLDEVVGNYRPELSEQYLRSIDPAALSFAWMGSTERGKPHYFRLQGEEFVFEYDNVQNDGNHVHSVWRDKARDFGARLLEQHYQSAHR